MIKKHKIPNQLVSDFDFWLSALSVSGLFRISSFEFRILIRWRPFDFAQDRLGASVGQGEGQVFSFAISD
jgi:hypothetical protein